MSFTPHAAYPALRLRRTRTTAWSRALVAETRLSPSDLIWPLFICEGERQRREVRSMPGVSRLSIDYVLDAAREAVDLGIPCLALFPEVVPDRLSPDGREALNSDNLICRATRAIKQADLPIGVLTDVALDPYTSHGHDGVVDSHGHVLNDATAHILADQALNQARAGADIIAPSDMMDGRVSIIRAALEAEGYDHVQIMAYAAKYASAFYGPFRDAIGSGGRLKGDKAAYQMDPANGEEALREVALDIAEGADSVMVKPGLPYLDVVHRVKSRFDIPVFAYQVSGEYAMITAAAAAHMIDRNGAVLESLMAFKRAGCAGILTYFAREAAQLLSARPR